MRGTKKRHPAAFKTRVALEAELEKAVRTGISAKIERNRT